MKNILLFTLSVALNAVMFAQPSATSFIESSNIKVKLSSIGEFGYDGNESESEMPIGSGKTCFFAQSLWLGGAEANSANLYTAVNTYRQTGLDFKPGPISNSTADFDSEYDKVYSMSKVEIINHIANYADPSYTIPNSITDWPANGDIANGESQQLAPFKDQNANGIYEPELGEYPLIRGDNALYVIYNDNRSHAESANALAIRAEVHLMAYTYNAEEEHLKNTIFLHYNIHNKGSVNFDEFYVSQWIDGDLGYYADDFVGTDSIRNTIMFYNGDAIDGSATGYGENPPVYGMLTLSQALSSSIYYNNDFDPISGSPSDSVDFFNYMKGNYKNGQKLHEFNTTHPNSNFHYNHNIPFTEEMQANSPGDRRMMSSIKEHAFNAGEVICLDQAMVFARDTTLNNVEQLTHYINQVELVQNHYDANFLDNCDKYFDLSTTDYDAQSSQVEVFYTNEMLNVNSTNKPIRQINLYNALGELVKVYSVNETEWSTSKKELSKGVYICQILLEGNRVVNRKVVLN
ncbi:MAG: T9SS type A sorting domain-containing protein [Flavobacteriales bacterium]